MKAEAVAFADAARAAELAMRNFKRQYAPKGASKHAGSKVPAAKRKVERRARNAQAKASRRTNR